MKNKEFCKYCNNYAWEVYYCPRDHKFAEQTHTCDGFEQRSHTDIEDAVVCPHCGVIEAYRFKQDDIQTCQDCGGTYRVVRTITYSTEVVK